MFRLDYLSCVLTILSTILVGRRKWHGWVVAGVNSLVICFIGYRTAQTGFIPANLFCLAIYGYNVWQWRDEPADKKEEAAVESKPVLVMPQPNVKHLPRP
jgi:nicotinamide riboside transporter PnuC